MRFGFLERCVVLGALLPRLSQVVATSGTGGHIWRRRVVWSLQGRCNRKVRICVRSGRASRRIESGPLCVQGIWQYVPKPGEGFPEDFVPFMDMNTFVQAKYPPKKKKE